MSNFVADFRVFMRKVRIKAIRQSIYHDLMVKYENPIEHTCDVIEGQQWISFFIASGDLHKQVSYLRAYWV